MVQNGLTVAASVIETEDGFLSSAEQKRMEKLEEASTRSLTRAPTLASWLS